MAVSVGWGDKPISAMVATGSKGSALCGRAGVAVSSVEGVAWAAGVACVASVDWASGIAVEELTSTGV